MRITRVTHVAPFAMAAVAGTLAAQAAPRSTPGPAVPTQVEAAIRTVPRPVLSERIKIRMHEDRSGSFTPANLKGVTPQDLARGRIIGRAELSASNQLGVPAGTYDYVIASSNGTWHLYAVAGGKVVREAKYVRVTIPASHPQVPAQLSGAHPSVGRGAKPIVTTPLGGSLMLTPSSVVIPWGNGIFGCSLSGDVHHVTVTAKDVHGTPVHGVQISVRLSTPDLGGWSGSTAAGGATSATVQPSGIDVRLNPCDIAVAPLVAVVSASGYKSAILPIEFSGDPSYLPPSSSPPSDACSELPPEQQAACELNEFYASVNPGPNISWGW